jgi:hypothetical protein
MSLPDLPDLVVPHRSGFEFGVGFNAGSQQIRNTAVVGEATGVAHAGGVAAQRFDVSRVTSSHDLAKKLSIDIQASAGCGAFGAGASARFGYMEESKVQTSSLFMAITCSLALEDLSIDSPVLAAEAAALVDKPDVLEDTYGNMFARGCARGGLFVGVLQIDTKDISKSNEISAALKGSYGFASADASTKLSELASSHEMEIFCSMYSEGGPAFDTTHPEDPQKLLDYANKWFEAMHTDPDHMSKPINWTLAPLSIAAGPLPVNSAEILHGQDVMVFCARERIMLLDQMNLMDHITQHPNDYDFVAPTTPADVVNAFNGYQSDLQLIADTASHALNQVNDALMPQQYAERNKATYPDGYPRGIPPTPMPTMAKGVQNALAMQGQGFANEDPLLMALRLSVPEGPAREGFDVGVAVMHANSLWGPGAQRRLESLGATEQTGFNLAAGFCLARNTKDNAALAATGATIARQDPEVLAARNKEAPGLEQLGFDVASALYGDKKFGALGSTLMGPGSDQIRASIKGGEKGFNDAFNFHTARHYAP